MGVVRRDACDRGAAAWRDEGGVGALPPTRRTRARRVLGSSQLVIVRRVNVSCARACDHPNQRTCSL